MEFVFSIPDEYKLDNRLYSVMLHKFFPKFYKDIPWQQTGKPAGVIKPNPLPYRIANKVRWVFCKMGLLSSPQLFTNYPEWIRDKATKSKIEDLLLPGDSFVNKSFQDNRAKKLLSAHASRLSDHSNEILKLVTIEVYLATGCYTLNKTHRVKAIG